MKEIAGRSRSLCASEQEEDKIYYFDFFSIFSNLLDSILQ